MSIRSQLQAKKFVVPQEKTSGKDGPVLSFATKYKCQATYKTRALPG